MIGVDGKDVFVPRYGPIGAVRTVWCVVDWIFISKPLEQTPVGIGCKQMRLGRINVLERNAVRVKVCRIGYELFAHESGLSKS